MTTPPPTCVTCRRQAVLRGSCVGLNKDDVVAVVGGTRCLLICLHGLQTSVRMPDSCLLFPVLPNGFHTAINSRQLPSAPRGVTMREVWEDNRVAKLQDIFSLITHFAR